MKHKHMLYTYIYQIVCVISLNSVMTVPYVFILKAKQNKYIGKEHERHPELVFQGRHDFQPKDFLGCSLKNGIFLIFRLYDTAEVKKSH